MGVQSEIRRVTANALGVIPARMASTRFPGKPLMPILGKPMLWHVWRRSQLSGVLDDVVIATCDDEIRHACEAFGATVVMTSLAHTRSGDRVAEVAAGSAAEIVLNIQGDEPLVHPQLVRDVVETFAQGPDVQCVNPIAVIEDPADLTSPNTVKVVCDLRGLALYFSRHAIPSDLMIRRGEPVFRQVPILGFRRQFLLDLALLAEGPLERQESVDLLRPVEHGLPIHCIRTVHQTVGVDEPGDLARVEQLLLADPVYQEYCE